MKTADVIEDLELIIYAAREPSQGYTTTPDYSDMKNNLTIIESLARDLIRDLQQPITEAKEMLELITSSRDAVKLLHQIQNSEHDLACYEQPWSETDRLECALAQIERREVTS